MDEVLTKQNSDALANLKYSSVRRRIAKELETMYPLFAQINVKMRDDQLLEITIYEISTENELQIYGFVLKSDYPFRPPAIFYQNRPYLEYLLSSQFVRNSGIIKTVSGHSCFCCHSVNCTDNWSPAMTLSKIINEIRRIKTQKRHIINKIMCHIIKRKYLIDDIDLDGWLFVAEGHVRR